MGKATAERTTWDGQPVVRMASGDFTAMLVPAISGNLIELRETRRRLDILRRPPDFKTFAGRSRVYGIPVIFPPNRIRDGVFRTPWREYKLPINSPDGHHCHGTIGLDAWDVRRVDAKGENAVVEAFYRNGPGKDFYQSFPHEFEFSNTYALTPQGLEHTYRVTNLGGERMPAGVGFHIAFNVPFAAGSRPENVKLRCAVGKRWEIDSRTIPTEHLLALTEVESNYRRDGLPAYGFSIRDHYLAEPLEVAGAALNAAILEDRSAGCRIVYEAGATFKHWMIWNDLGDKGYVCPEPMTWVIDAPNRTLPTELTGYRLLGQGETMEDRLTIRVEST